MATDIGFEAQIDKYFNDCLDVLSGTRKLSKEISSVADVLISCLESGGTVFWCGNGGSASDSQHLAAELIGRFKLDRSPLRSIALTTDTSILTATGNDFGFDHIFSRQIQALGRKGDLLIGISTSGKSVNVINALREASKLGLSTVAMTGMTPNEMWKLSDLYLTVPSAETSHIQEMHILMGQLICGLAEEHFFGNPNNAHS
jgi:D-sedoheptulose 7-phosphate isomerase